MLKIKSKVKKQNQNKKKIIMKHMFNYYFNKVLLKRKIFLKIFINLIWRNLIQKSKLIIKIISSDKLKLNSLNMNKHKIENMFYKFIKNVTQYNIIICIY